MPDVEQLTEVLTAQLMTTLQAPLIEIAACFENNQDDEGIWDACNITEAIFPILERLGVIHRCEACDFDFAWTPGAGEAGPGNCPQWDSHSCEGGCGNTNDECTCENCSHCGYYDCECPQCENCEESIHECGCSETDRMWPANA